MKTNPFQLTVGDVMAALSQMPAETVVNFYDTTSDTPVHAVSVDFCKDGGYASVFMWNKVDLVNHVGEGKSCLGQILPKSAAPRDVRSGTGRDVVTASINTVPPATVDNIITNFGTRDQVTVTSLSRGWSAVHPLHDTKEPRLPLETLALVNARSGQCLQIDLTRLDPTRFTK